MSYLIPLGTEWHSLMELVSFLRSCKKNLAGTFEWVKPVALACLCGIGRQQLSTH